MWTRRQAAVPEGGGGVPGRGSEGAMREHHPSRQPRLSHNYPKSSPAIVRVNAGTLLCLRGENLYLHGNFLVVADNVF